MRALLAADRNQRFARSRMTDAERAASPEIDFSPLIIADADTGHGGDAHVRNLIRRFVEAGVPGYHIEDQKPGAKKCGHQGGKVLVPCDEQIKRLNAARLQLDVMQRRRDHRGADRCRGGEPPRRRRRRARPALHPGRDAPRRAVLQVGLPGPHAAPPARRRRRPQRAPHLRALARPRPRPPTAGSRRSGWPRSSTRQGARMRPPPEHRPRTRSSASRTASSRRGSGPPGSRRTVRRSPRRWHAAPTRALKSK